MCVAWGRTTNKQELGHKPGGPLSTVPLAIPQVEERWAGERSYGSKAKIPVPLNHFQTGFRVQASLSPKLVGGEGGVKIFLRAGRGERHNSGPY